MKTRPKILIFSLLLGLATYHLNNFREEGYVAAWRQLQLIPRVQFFRGGRTRFDLSADVLRRLGYLIRFTLGQDSEMVARIGHTSPLYLFRRSDHVFSLDLHGIRLRQNLIPRLREAIAEIEAQGVQVVLLPVPPKSAVDGTFTRAKLGEHEFYAQTHPQLVDPAETYQNFLDVAPGRVVNLLQIYRDHLKRGGEPVFIPWDFHWNSLGISLAAEGVLNNLKSHGVPVRPWERQRLGQNEPQWNHSLLNQYQLPEYFLRRNSDFQWRETIYRLSEAVTTEERLPAKEERLILVGTSFCKRWAGTVHGLGNTLATMLHRPVEDNCVGGGGLKGTWTKMRDEKFQWRKGDILVWELPLPTLVDDNYDFHLAPVSTDSAVMLIPS